MKKYLFLWGIACLIVSCSPAPAISSYNEGINITPKPVEMNVKEGNFNLTPKTVFSASTPEAAKIASFFAAKIKRSTGFSLETVKESAPDGSIQLLIEQDLPVNEEGYMLQVAPEKVIIKATSSIGI